MCEFHESTCNGFGDIWWTDNPIYFSSIDESCADRYLTSVACHSESDIHGSLMDSFLAQALIACALNGS